MTEITVGICTFRRESLAETVLSVIRQENLCPARIVIADNDDTPSAAPLIEKLRQQICIPLTYVHAPARNISIARNAVLGAVPRGLLALIDDDERAASDWLEQLHLAWQPGIAAIFGPMDALYPDQAPDWMKQLSPHSNRPGLKRGELRWGYTSNCLIDRDHPVMQNLRFDPDLGHRQSEDGSFFHEGFRRGARYALAPAALVREEVAPDRMSGDWLLRRRFRHGKAYARQFPSSRSRTAITAFAKMCFLALSTVLTFPVAHRRWGFALRTAFQAGIVREIVS